MAYHHPVCADLHCHSNASDGQFSPQEIALMAIRNGVELWSLTDHDTLAGLAQARAVAQQHGITFINGVEISIRFLERTVHMVGLHFDPNHVGLNQALDNIAQKRIERARIMADRLAELGIPDSFEGALKYAGNANMLGRMHFAKYLKEIKTVSSIQKAFNKYLGDNQQAFIQGQWPSLAEAMQWVHQAGGICVLAHPGRYAYTPEQRHQLLTEFKDNGGQAIEVVTGSHSVPQYEEYRQIAKEYDFYASCGSDYHNPEKGYIEVGRVPALPHDLRPVWELWQ